MEENQIIIKKALSNLNSVERKIRYIKESNGIEVEPEKTKEFFKDLPDDVLERSADALLAVIAELDAGGRIEEVETAQDARDALLQLIRQLFANKTQIASLSRKLSAFGAKNILRKQRRELGKGL